MAVSTNLAETHRSTIMTASRAATINADNRRPARPPWVVLPQRPQTLVVASMVRPDELQELHANPDAASPSSGNAAPFFERTVRIAVPDTATAIAVTCDNHLVVGTVRGTVGVVFWDEEAERWHEYRHIMDASPVPSVLTAVSVTDMGIVLAGDERGTVVRSSLTVGGRTQLIKGNGARVLAMDAVSRSGGFIGCVSDACGVVKVIDGKHGEQIQGVPKFGNSRTVRWNGEKEVHVGGDDGLVHTAKVNGRETKIEMQRSGTDGEEDGHVSYVTAVCVRDGQVMSAGMDGRVVLWRDTEGEVIYTRKGESIYGMEWVEDRVIYVSSCVDDKGKCMLYRVKLPPSISMR